MHLYRVQLFHLRASTRLGGLRFSLIRSGAKLQALEWDCRGLISEALVERDSRRPGASPLHVVSSDEFWVVVRPRGHVPPQQGWKIHVSAGVRTAETIFARSLPILLDSSCSFKVVATLTGLADLNEGRRGRAQVGKFITVYPATIADALKIANALDHACDGLRGPIVLTDHPFRPRSVVSYRFGGFTTLPTIRTEVGEVIPAIRAPDGRLEPDERTTEFRLPAWVNNPFHPGQNRYSSVEKRCPQLIGKNYVVVAALHTSPRSDVYLCFDVRRLRKCIVKGVSDDGSGGFDRLGHEAHILKSLAPRVGIPGFVELFRDGDRMYLAREDIDGQPLNRLLAARRRKHEVPALSEISTWCASLAGVLEEVHEAGMVYRDLSAANVIVAQNNRVHLIDFELCAETRQPTADVPFLHRTGTRGYMSPQQASGNPPMPSDDVYSLGALLYHLATGVDPCHAPDPGYLLSRHPALLNPDLDTETIELIAACLKPRPEQRPESPQAVAAELRCAYQRTQRKGRRSTKGAIDLGECEPLQLVQKFADLLCGDGEVDQCQRRFTWTDQSEYGTRSESLDLNSGAAGGVLALAEIVSVLGAPRNALCLAHNANLLGQRLHEQPDLPPGLYVGKAGIAAALLRAGQVLNQPALVTLASDVGHLIASGQPGGPDLFSGLAGTLRLHVLLYQETADQAHLHRALSVAEKLLAAAQHDQNVVHWTIPSSGGRLAGNAYFGYAHGAAGIADALLDLFDITGEERWLQTATYAFNGLAGSARPVLRDGSGFNWPVHRVWPYGHGVLVSRCRGHYPIPGSSQRMSRQPASRSHGTGRHSYRPAWHSMGRPVAVPWPRWQHRSRR